MTPNEPTLDEGVVDAVAHAIADADHDTTYHDMARAAITAHLATTPPTPCPWCGAAAGTHPDDWDDYRASLDTP